MCSLNCQREVMQYLIYVAKFLFLAYHLVIVYERDV